ncbi:sodium-dependent glucose transporter 1C-like [Liolophura sinensis]|uniref:sodium-dependent glucose transporter 1C-like n=1 Tax=Liolophura sinensis TaxID=3198878 RepID=UPI003158DD1E
MWFMMFCQGTFEGIINIAGQEIILLLWGEKSAGPMHLLHFGFGMGSFINPLIAQPFLATEIPTNVTDLGHTSSFNTSNVTTVETLVGSRIEYAYLIAALVSASFSSTFFWFQYKGVPHGGYVEDHSGPKQCTKPVKTGCKQYVSLIDPATCADGKRLAGFSIFALLFIYFFQAVGGERIYSKFIRNFALDQLHFSSSEATYLNSSFWISFSIGRFLGFVVAIWVPIRILIMVECFSGLGFAILLNVLGHNSKLAVWVLTQPMALFIAPLFPSGVAWSDHYLKMSGIGITILIAGGSIGGAAYIWILGFVYPNYGPQTFLYIVAVYSAAACVSVSLMSFAGCLHGDRFQKQRMEMEMEPDKDDNKTVTYITSESLEDLKP